MGKTRDILIRFLGESGSLKKATGDADKGFKSLSDRLDHVKKSVGSAEGVTGKLKAGWSGVGEAFAGSGAKMAVASAGVAAVGVAVAKSVSAYQDATLEVGKFRDATGTTSEEASRFVEVFNDLGVGADAGQAAIGRFSKALGENGDAFSKYGVAVVRAADGTVDMAATFVGAVDALNRIEDPARRAAAGADMFGRGWQGMAEIIASGAPALKTALESVQPSKVFSDDDIAAGRELRDAFDSLADAGEGLLLTLGKALAPVISELAPVIAKLADAIGPLVEKIGGLLANALEALGPIIEAAVGALDMLASAAVKAMDVIESAVSDVKIIPGDMWVDRFVDKWRAGGASVEQIIDNLRRQFIDNPVIGGPTASAAAAQAEIDKLTGATQRAFEDAVDARLAAQERAALQERQLLGEQAAQYAEYQRSRQEAYDAAEEKAFTDQYREYTESRIAANKAEEQSIRDADNAARDRMNAGLEAIDANYRLAEQTERTAEAQWEYLAASERTPGLVRDTAQAILAQAEAAVRAEESTRGLASGTLDAASQNAILVNSLATVAAKLSPGDPLLTELNNYISTLGGVPPVAATDVSAKGVEAATVGLEGVTEAAGEIPAVVETNPQVVGSLTALTLLAYVQSAADKLNGTKVTVTPTVNVGGALGQVNTLISALNRVPGAATSAVNAARSANSAILTMRAGSVIRS